MAFVAIFVLGPTTLFVWLEDRLDAHGILVNIAEGVFRVALFVGYLWVIGRTKDIHRVFEYHGAEHKTIAAYEHDDELDPRADRPLPEGARTLRHEFPDHRDDHHDLRVLVVRDAGDLCGGCSRGSIAIPVIAGLAYEALRLGARFPDSLLMRALMRPGIWLQRITTQEPDAGQIEVAVASFREVLRREEGAPSPERPS